MSLQLVAQHLAQKGRGPDSTLVHMSNREVAGLNALAQKHGGQLSVNPDTGLPEAGFLDSILPVVAGAGLTYFSGGAINPLMAAGIVGGISALDSKDLSKGLVAGLGAYGGGSMVGGLAGLGATSTGANELAREAAVNNAVQNGTYQSAVGSGLSEFAAQPMNSLSTLGGGSVLKGSLPILASLAPAAADYIDNAGDEEEGDGAPAQKKGYIRKYAFDPATGQYKQVGAYEAGGDPNRDVSSEAGTAGAFGGVGQSEYQKSQGMAAGGVTDSSRIYDYLMGRGPNPMQFRNASPQVSYNMPKPPEPIKPITPTTPILDQQYDEYGNKVNKDVRDGGGGYSSSPEGRAEREKQMSDFEARDPEGYEKRNDWIGKVLEAGPMFQLGKAAINALKPNPDAYVRVSPEDQFKDYIPGDPSFKVPSFLKSLFPAVSLEPSYYSVPGITSLKNEIKEVVPAPLSEDQSVKLAEQYGGYSPPEGDPAQRAAIRDAINKTDFSGMEGGGGRASSGDNNGRGVNPGGYSNSLTRSNDNEGGSMAATGGLATPYGFQHMARGGLPAPHAFYRQGKFGYKGPQVYADGGGIADLAGHYNLGGYSDGGRLLKGPGDGISDDIPAIIGHNQPARLADNEFVIPARIVSEIGNGSTDAGARALYKMIDRIQQRRAKTVGKDKIAVNSGAYKELDKL